MAEEKRSGSKRGFAAMNTDQQRAIASKGGRAAHARGSAHEFTADEAREAGRKGGVAVSQNRAHMSEIGRRGGVARSAAARSRRSEESQSAGAASQESGALAGRESTGRNSDRAVARPVDRELIGSSSGSARENGDNREERSGSDYRSTSRRETDTRGSNANGSASLGNE
jgi:general stress protein YciG